MRLALLPASILLACLHASTDLSTTSEPDTTTADTTGTTAEPDTTTADTSSTTEPLPCDDDPACGPGETPETCPEQCSACGDGLQSAAELCDNGTANKTYCPPSLPLRGARNNPSLPVVRRRHLTATTRATPAPP